MWGATQQVGDFPDEAKKALAMMEYVICLWSHKHERDQIARLYDLSHEQRVMMDSLHKAKRQYVEGVLLSNQGTYLYRNMPPPEVLALAMTDPDEHAQRAALMKRFDCKGVEASLLMAQRLQGQPYDIKATRALLQSTQGDHDE